MEITRSFYFVPFLSFSFPSLPIRGLRSFPSSPTHASRSFPVPCFKGPGSPLSPRKACERGHVAPLLTLTANLFDTLTVKQWEIMINSDVLLFSAPMRKHLTSSIYITSERSSGFIQAKFSNLGEPFAFSRAK